MEDRFREMYRNISEIVSPLHGLGLGALSTACLQETYIRMHEKLKTDLSLEIGAHEATYSRRVKELYGDALEVCAVEGSPKTWRYYSERENFQAAGINYMHAVVSSSSGTVSFYEYEDAGYAEDRSAGFSSMHIRDAGMGGKMKRSKATVQAIRGDALIAANYPQKSSIALWIDVEGSQKEVLDSLSESFRAGKVNSVYIEVESQRLWPAQLMLDNDIVLFMDKHGFVPFLRDNEYGVQYNIIFLNKALLDKDYEEFYLYYNVVLRKHLQNMLGQISSL